MSKKIRAKRTPANSDVERLDHMIDQSLVRKKNFKPLQSIANEKAIFEMIDTRIGHMLAKSCEIEAKIESIEKKKTKRKPNNKSNQNDLIRSSMILSSSNKKKVYHSPPSINSVDLTETEESIPQLQSASKFLLEQNNSSPSSQQSVPTKKSQKIQQKQEVIKKNRREENMKNQKKQEINFFQPEQDIPFHPIQHPAPVIQNAKDVSMEGLITLIQTLANEIHEMHEEQQILKGQIEKLQECVFSNE